MSTSSTAQQPKLLDQVRQAIRLRHMSFRTEQSHVFYIRYFIHEAYSLLFVLPAEPGDTVLAPNGGDA